MIHWRYVNGVLFCVGVVVAIPVCWALLEPILNIIAE